MLLVNYRLQSTDVADRLQPMITLLWLFSAYSPQIYALTKTELISVTYVLIYLHKYHDAYFIRNITSQQCDYFFMTEFHLRPYTVARYMIEEAHAHFRLSSALLNSSCRLITQTQAFGVTLKIAVYTKPRPHRNFDVYIQVFDTCHAR